MAGENVVSDAPDTAEYAGAEKPEGSEIMCPSRSFRLYYWVKIEVTAENSEDAITRGREVIRSADFDVDEQLTLDDVVEVDPITGMEVDRA